MTEFFAMGGYAAFVWPAYALSAIAIGAMVVLTVRAYGRAKARLAAIERDGA
jgi:heme exporter protein D